MPVKKVIEPRVFYPASALVFLIVLVGVVFTEATSTYVNALHQFITHNFGWYYISIVSLFLVFCIYVAFSRYGDIRLGLNEERPKYSNFTWISMLFSAGMGIGFVYYGVAEPLLHYLSPPRGQGGTVDAARQAMNMSYFHWGFHAWSIYAIVGMSLAYFSFRKGLPLTLRSTLYPVFGERINGPIGHTFDVIAVLGTLFGVSTSLGLGVMQVNGGLNHLFGWPQSTTVQTLLILVITLAATVSVVSGLDKGIKRLSEMNVVLGTLLGLTVFVLGPSIFIIKHFLDSTGFFLQNIVQTSLWSDSMRNTGWQEAWTVFYWAWWISWAPFVGMFLARISRGRTIREFLVGIIIVPSLLTFFWFSIFGGTALSFELNGDPGLALAVQQNVSTALFLFYENFPFSTLLSLISMLVIISFFITSSDSGSLVIDMLCSGGNIDPPKWQRVYWALLEGAVAAVLLAVGGLVALQTAAITLALPFGLIICLIVWGLNKAFREEIRATKPVKPVNVPIEKIGPSN